VRAAIASDGRVVAATTRAIYASTKGGSLELVYDAEGDTIHGLVASGDHVWFADGTQLGVVEADRISETNGATIKSDASLAPSPSGDVWVIAGGGLQRFMRAEAEHALAVRWNEALGAVFARSCSACHLPGGASGTDLSSPEAWESKRAEIHTRVVVSRTMPPEGHPLSDADRDAIRAWTEGGGRAQ
jgi:mono/diheme cytochrome c family protein